jgi:hypothetical protein
MIDNMRSQLSGLGDGQRTTNESALRQARPDLDESHYTENLLQIQNRLNVIMDLLVQRQPSGKYSSEPLISSEPSSILLRRLDDRARIDDIDRLRDIAPPNPRRAYRTSTLEDLFADTPTNVILDRWVTAIRSVPNSSK